MSTPSPPPLLSLLLPPRCHNPRSSGQRRPQHNTALLHIPSPAFLAALVAALAHQASLNLVSNSSNTASAQATLSCVQFHLTFVRVGLSWGVGGLCALQCRSSLRLRHWADPLVCAGPFATHLVLRRSRSLLSLRKHDSSRRSPLASRFRFATALLLRLSLSLPASRHNAFLLSLQITLGCSASFPTSFTRDPY